jgi:Carboxypeptidase regulatory-like domain/TonB-dependent Receptor Plug Domain
MEEAVRNGIFKLCLLLLSLTLQLAIGVQILDAQDVFGRISGTVTDPSGAVVAKAKVTITNEATKVKAASETDESGFYVAPNLIVGSYSVTIEQKGFKTSTKTGNVLVAGGRLTVDLTLALGTADETVTVEAIGETVNTVSGEVAHTVDTKQVQDLALNTRNYMQLVSLVPGVALTTDDQLSQSTNMAINNQTVNGNRADQNLVTVDGGYNMDSGSNGSQINNVGIDFVQEVTLQTSNFSAEYGRSAGASINVVTRSGGNSFHGGAFEFLRNQIFDAANPYTKWKATPSTAADQLKPPLRFNDFGWDLGGPIKKGKLYFFAGQEWKRIRQFAAPQGLTVPTSAELAGDFSHAGVTLCQPGTYNAPKTVNGVTTPSFCTGNATIPGNNIAAMMTADGKAIANVYKTMATQVASSFNDSDVANNATFAPNNPSNWREDIIRIDYHPNDKHTIYGRYIHDSLDLIAAFGTFSDGGTLPTVPTDRYRPGYSYQVAHVWTINGSLVNEAKINASWNKQRINPTGNTWQRSTYGFQFPLPAGFTGGRYPGGIPFVTFGSANVATGATANAYPALFDSPYFALLAPTTDITPTDDLTWVKGHHTIKTGVLFARNRKDQNSRPNSPQGNITFNANNTNTTGDPFADALLGNFTTFAAQSTDPIGHFRFNEFDWYVNDSWRVNEKLSLEIGLRYEHTTPTYTQGNNMVNFIPSLYDPAQAVTLAANGSTILSGNPYNGLVRPGEVPSDQLVRVPGGDSALVTSIPATAARGFFNPENLFAPRFGFSYSPFASGKTAFRGGFGIFYDKPEGNVVFGQPGIPPFLQSVSYNNANLSDPASGAAGALTVYGISAVDPNLVVARTMQFSLGVQQELPHGVMLQTSYVGLLGRHEMREPSINTPSLAAAIGACTDPNTPSTCQNYNFIRPYVGYADIRQYRSDANSNYNSWQTSLTKRKGNLTAGVSYTYSKALGNASGFQDNIEPEDPYNLGILYGPLSSDRTHIFVASYSYAIPFLRNMKGVGGAALAGWEISGITRLQSGAALTPVASVATGSGSITRLAQSTGASIQYGDPTPGQWFNKAAFAAPSATAEGNAGVGSIRGPAWETWDLSLRKSFNLPHEGMSLAFQADAFNAFNHANWTNPNVTVTSGSYGQVAGANNARNIQFGLKFKF